MSESRLGPVESDYFISYMEKLGFPVDKEGMCHGYAWEAAHAILSRTELAFIDRSQTLYDRYMQQKSIEDIREEKDLDRFFHGVAVQHQPELFPDVRVKDNALSLQTPLATMSYLHPETLDARNAVAEITSFSGLYDVSDLTIYLQTFRNNIKSQFHDRAADFSPIAIVMETGDHTITIGYDLSLDSWVIYDANFITKGRINDDALMAKCILTSFYNSQFAPISTSIYSLKTDSNTLSASCTDWLKEIDEINQVTEAKAQYCSDDGSSWLYTAIRKNDLDKVNALLKAGANPNIHNSFDLDFTPLGVAVQQGNLEIVKSLVVAKANIDELIFAGRTALFLAIHSANVEIVKYLLESDADVNVKIPLEEASGIEHLDLLEVVRAFSVDEIDPEKKQSYLDIEHLLIPYTRSMSPAVKTDKATFFKEEASSATDALSVTDWSLFTPQTEPIAAVEGKRKRIWENDDVIADVQQEVEAAPIAWQFKRQKPPK